MPRLSTMSRSAPFLFGLSLLALLGTCFLVWLMDARSADRKLWGYLPLYFYLAGWLSVTSLLLAWRARRGHDLPYRRLAAAVGSGVLLGFGFPGFLPFPFLLLIALVPLIALERDLRLTHDKSVGGKVFLYCFHTFFLYNVLASYWVTNTAFGAGLVAVFANTLLMCLPWLAYHYTARLMPRLGFASLIAYWITFEYFHYHWELNWPWLMLGNGFAQFPALIQWYEWTGAFGGTLWILVVNYLVAGQLRAPTRLSPTLPREVKLAAVVILPILVSLIRYATYTVPTELAPIRVASIQPNLEPHYEKFTIPAGRQIERFAKLTGDALAASAAPVDYVVFPETSIDNVREEEPAANTYLRQLTQIVGPRPNTLLVTGVDAYHIFQDNEARSRAVRTQGDTASGKAFDWEALNGALQYPLDPAAAPQLVQTYRKGVFVPGADSFPYGRYLWFLGDFVEYLGGTLAGRGTQPERSVFSGGPAKVAPVICYESVFGEYFTGYIQAGAEVIFVMTNDGWWDNTGGHRQHLYFSSLRAIENRRDVVRSANTGISAFIDQRGKIISRTAYDEPTYLLGQMQPNRARTFYSRWGDLIARAAMFMAIFVLLSAFVKARLPDRER
ncbi:MAG: apolipoprotein N-acyltransferase [Saprospiraceae bacterium]